MLTSTQNIYLLLLAALGWLLSLYFGFFRFRQFVWSRNKVRYDLLLKVDQRRANLSAKIILLLELDKRNRRVEVGINSLIRRYFELMLQVDFLREQEAIDANILRHWRSGMQTDLRQIMALRPALGDQFSRLAKGHRELPEFTSSLLSDFLTTEA
ncbi:hypothetical protein [Lewinella sp. W8]|uniref:hypothetical protein n=1 Tax=Lewinella sp. W8 TaxID=2528208 RepID=UPI001067AB3C|nr:hypothetical protein [Lewinella sp. W8]MTB53566.1 hypothetical protein [Lewinella sp. W8]